MRTESDRGCDPLFLFILEEGTAAILSGPRTCKIRLYDDGISDVVIYHGMGDDERQWLRYERTTGEILWEYVRSARMMSESLTGNETIHEPVYEESDVRIISTVELLYR